ncbi:MAG: stage II sporulation protein P [Clostridia bacterium]|nr:stage II sporulation protein P [Clostridia bacterium]
MHETSTSHLPVKVHTDRRVAVTSPPPLYNEPPPEKSSNAYASPAAKRYGSLRMGLICLLLAGGGGVALVSVFRSVGTPTDGWFSLGGIGQALGQGILSGGLPPTHNLGAAGTDSHAGGETATAPNEPPINMEETLGSVADTDRELMVTGVPADPTEPLETVTEPMDPETDMLPISTAPDETAGEIPPTEETDAPLEETELPVPDGCFPIVSVDMSEQGRGVGYITGNAEDIPARLPSGWLWGTDAPPTVLIVNTHPYEGYSDGRAWYDPAEGGLAVTDTPNATDGTVAFGAAMTRALRDRGVTVIQLRIAVSAEDTAAEIYDRTETMIRYYCRLYPDIGLVLNLRRSAELTPDGEVLRTAGSYQGESCAQTRISVNGGRSKTATGRDLAVALALREELWDLDPSLSRPVWVKSGEGLISDLTDVCVLTVEAGSAGNTYSESRRLVEPLAVALQGLWRDNESYCTKK